VLYIVGTNKIHVVLAANEYLPYTYNSQITTGPCGFNTVRYCPSCGSLQKIELVESLDTGHENIMININIIFKFYLS
jgi:hypothetical protein